jgi:transposase-like protein
MAILYFWSLQIRRTTIATMAGCDRSTVRSVLHDWYQLLQEDLQEEDCQIGGIDENGNPIVVEIDESKFGRRKYHRGHRVEGVWVVGGVERTPQRKCFLIVVPNRNQRTLTNIIRTYVKRGSTIYTDCWAGYNELANLGMDFRHQTVNHSETFRDGVVCTNTIEGIHCI